MWPERQPVQPRKKDSPKYISLIAFSHTLPHTHKFVQVQFGVSSAKFPFANYFSFSGSNTKTTQGRKFLPPIKTWSGLGSKKIALCFGPKPSLDMKSQAQVFLL